MVKALTNAAPLDIARGKLLQEIHSIRLTLIENGKWRAATAACLHYEGVLCYTETDLQLQEKQADFNRFKLKLVEVLSFDTQAQPTAKKDLWD